MLYHNDIASYYHWCCVSLLQIHETSWSIYHSPVYGNNIESGDYVAIYGSM